MNGFSLVELLLVIALMGIVSIAAFPLSVSLYNLQVLNDTKSSLLATLRQAHVSALTQKNDTDHGVKLLPDSYVLFEGSSYATRNEAADHVISFAPTVTATGADEIVFTKFTGLPTATGTVTIEAGEESRVILVRESGITE
jgi:prepilin-type N-terminal cleavage/methylation domain-containing protein